MQHYGYFIENELYWAGLYGGWEKVSLRLWSELAADIAIIFDIGANTGIYSLIAKTVNPASEVHAFEPLPAICTKLEHNCRMNDFDVRCNATALSDVSGDATVFIPPGHHVYSVTVNANHNPPDVPVREEQITTDTLSRYIANNHINRIDLMKIDVDWHEPEVLAGFGPYLQRFRPALLIEILDDANGARVEETLKDCGYVYYDIDEIGRPRKTLHLRKSSAYNFLACSPEQGLKLGLD